MCSKASLLILFDFEFFPQPVSVRPVKALPAGIRGGRRQCWQPACLYKRPVQAAESSGSTRAWAVRVAGEAEQPLPSLSMAMSLACRSSRAPPRFPVAPVTSVPRLSGLTTEELLPRKAGFEHFLLFSPFPVAFPRTTSLTSSSPGVRRDAADVRAARRESQPGARGPDSAFPGYQDKYSCGNDRAVGGWLD